MSKNLSNVSVQENNLRVRSRNTMISKAQKKTISDRYINQWLSTSAFLLQMTTSSHLRH